MRNDTKIVTLDLPYLYHTTFVFNEKSEEYFEELRDIYPDYQMPEKGNYPTALNIKKYFTISEHCNYSSPQCGYDEVFLRYKVKRPLVLAIYESDFMYPPHHNHSSDDSHSSDDELLNMEDYCVRFSGEECDGYISREDHVEVFLKNAAMCVEEDCEVINFLDEVVVVNCKCQPVLRTFQRTYTDFIKIKRDFNGEIFFEKTL